MSKNKRSRTFATIIYPNEELTLEKIKEDIEEKLHVQSYLVLHDKDDNKPHCHLLMLFDSPKTCSTFKKELLDIMPYCVGLEVVQSREGYLHYLSHDGTDKALYDFDEIYHLCGAKPYKDAIKDISTRSRLDVLKEIIDYVEKNRIISFSALCRIARDNDDWLVCLDKSCYFILAYINSRAMYYDKLLK